MDNLKSQDDKFSKALEFFNNSTVEQKDDMIRCAFESAFDSLEKGFSVGVPKENKSDKVTNSPFVEINEKPSE
jgi:hypothetical protein